MKFKTKQRLCGYYFNEMNMIIENGFTDERDFHVYVGRVISAITYYKNFKDCFNKEQVETIEKFHEEFLKEAGLSITTVDQDFNEIKIQ
jgi:hypothetical protein